MRLFAARLTACMALLLATTAAFAQAGKTELLWLGQAAFRLTTPGGKVIMIDPWIRTNPTTPAEYKDLEKLGKVDLILVTHGHFDHIADAPALAMLHKARVFSPGDLNATLTVLKVLPLLAAGSLRALHALTQRFTAEFAIRPFIEHHPALTLATLKASVPEEVERTALVLVGPALASAFGHHRCESAWGAELAHRTIISLKPTQPLAPTTPAAPPGGGATAAARTPARTDHRRRRALLRGRTGQARGEAHTDAEDRLQEGR